jgi:hypothetical protein
MPGRPNLEQPRELLEWANETADDPRRTRLDLLQVANYLALQARQNAELRSSVSQVSEFLAGQSVPAEDLSVAVRTGNGWPVIEALPGPGSYFHAGLRLAAHSALRRPALTENFEAVFSDLETLSTAVQRTLDAAGPQWSRELTLATAEMAAEPEFRSRLIAAAKDVQQLVTGGELPTWDDFTEGPPWSAWPPLTLGICPVMGGAFREDPKDWETVVGGGSITAFVACGVGFGTTGRPVEAGVCIGGVIAVLILVAIITAP